MDPGEAGQELEVMAWKISLGLATAMPGSESETESESDSESEAPSHACQLVQTHEAHRRTGIAHFLHSLDMIAGPSAAAR